MTLSLLLDRAGVNRMQRHLWFQHCQLVGKSLLVADINDFGTIKRCFLPVITGVWPEIEVVFSPSVIKALPESKPTNSTNRAFKKSYYDKLEKAEQQDMLGR